MSNAQTSFQERHSPVFLRALARFGKIAPACSASYVSRDAVYDWIKKDATFCQAVAEAKRIARAIKRPEFRDHVWLFYKIVEDYIPVRSQAAVLSEINIALAQIEFKKGRSSTADPLSRNQSRSLLSGETAVTTAGDSKGRDVTLGKNEPYT